MRHMIGVLTLLIAFLAYSFIPEINEWLIDVGILNDLKTYRTSTWIYFYMVIFITIALVFLYSLLIFVFIYLTGKGWGREVNRAKLQSKQEYGVTFLYYFFLDEKYRDSFVQDISSYPRRLIEHYEKLNNLSGYDSAADKGAYEREHFEKYRRRLGWPNHTN